jgi:hypothetical protein
MIGLAGAKGRVLGGCFRAVSLVKSAQGIETWFGEDQSGRPIVIKTIASATVPPSTQHRLEQEAQILGELDSPFVVPSVHVGREDGLVFLVLPFVSGITLTDRVRRKPLDARETARLGGWMMMALAHAHGHGVLHRDVKPSNIIVNAETELRRACLIDFGLARSNRVHSSIRDVPVGTIRYTSPEQAGLLDADVDERSDLYSAGIVLFECLTGRPPFLGDTITELLRQHVSSRPPELRELGISAPRALDQVIQRLLQKDPRDRYHSAEGVLADLSAIDEALARGQTEPFIVIGARDVRPTLTEPAFVGRTGDLAGLMNAAEQARRGKGQLTLIEAESGGGKTRLLDELALRIGRTAWVVRGQGVADQAPRPFQMFTGVADQLLGIALRAWVARAARRTARGGGGGAARIGHDSRCESGRQARA